MKILVIDDHALIREGLSLVLKELDPHQPTRVLQACDCAQAFAMIEADRDLDLVLLDYHLPDMDGLAALSVFGKDYPELPVVMLSGSANPTTVQRALSLGAAGFVTKSGQSDELLKALRLVLDGEIYVPTAQAWNGQAAMANAPVSAPVFTPRQEEVLQLLLDGCSNREIGQKLHLSDETIKNHVSGILRGFGVKTRIQAALEAGRWGYSKSSSSPG